LKISKKIDMHRRLMFIFKTIQKNLLKDATNSPYLSGDSVANLCDYVVANVLPDANELRNQVKRSKSIFVNGHNLREFSEIVGDLLEGKVLISGNSDQNFISPIVFKTKPSLFLCQNNASSIHAEVKTLPIGIENIKLARSGFKHQHQGVRTFKHLNRVLIPPMSPTNSIRVEVINQAKKFPDVFDVQTEFLSTRKYFKLMKNYRFVFACEGNGFDTHRVWEILYKNSFPVVLKSRWTESLNWLDLPILEIDKIDDLDQPRLQEFCEANSNFIAKETPQLWIPFWESLILAKTRNEN
jgi:hypothetical protein